MILRSMFFLIFSTIFTNCPKYGHHLLNIVNYMTSAESKNTKLRLLLQ